MLRSWTGWLLAGAVACPALAAAGGDVWLAIDAPAEANEQRIPVPWTLVRGRAGTGDSAEIDLMLALDLSASTQRASGDDIDADGRTGRQNVLGKQYFWPGVLPGPMVIDHRLDLHNLSSDSGDTVRRAEIRAARELLGALDLGRTRVGLVTFSGNARIRAPLGSSRDELEHALEGLPRRDFVKDGTNLHQALVVAGESLLAGRPAPPERRRQLVVLLTDGVPTHPGLDPALSTAAVAAALGQRDVRLVLVPFGPDVEENRGYFEQVAQLNGGSSHPLATPGEVVRALPRMRLHAVSRVGIESHTTGEAARATRLLADGSFAGYVRLVPGRNEIAIEIESDGGERLRARREVVWSPAQPATRLERIAQAREIRRFLDELDARSTEARLLGELERLRRTAEERLRSLEIDPGP